MSCVLMIDDDLQFCELVGQCLRSAGFELTSIHDGKEGLSRALARERDYDLIVLDVGLPGMNGFEVLHGIRSKLDTPVLMMTACGQQADRILGLELGADDYLTKPFDSRELIARVRAILRRTGAGEAKSAVVRRPRRLVVGDVEMDTGARTVSQDGKRIRLTSVEMGLLEMLLRSAGDVVTRDHLARTVLGRSPAPYDRSVDVHVSSLRKKLGHAWEGIERIQTVRGVGYMYAYPSSRSPRKAENP
ncbi:MAG: response regulator transcription factor [Syntrophobacteraceae bacterium]